MATPQEIDKLVSDYSIDTNQKIDTVLGALSFTVEIAWKVINCGKLKVKNIGELLVMVAGSVVDRLLKDGLISEQMAATVREDIALTENFIRLANVIAVKVAAELPKSCCVCLKTKLPTVKPSAPVAPVSAPAPATASTTTEPAAPIPVDAVVVTVSPTEAAGLGTLPAPEPEPKLAEVVELPPPVAATE
jgi:hypothetical protein